MIKTQRLIIQPYNDNDEFDMIDLLTNKTIKESYIIPDFKTIDESRDYFKKLQTYSNSTLHYERGIYYNRQLIGFVNDVDIMDEIIEIGYVIHPKYHNQGFASEALNAIIDDLFHQGYHKIICCAFETNIPSFRVMEKCGMSRIDKTMVIEYQNMRQKCLYYSIETK